MKITTLCFGNINRSPAAKYAIERAVEKYGLNIEVDSCGTSDYNAGKRAAKRMRDTMAEHGFDLEEHRAKQITKELLDESDIIVYMDTRNYNKMQKMFTPEELGNKLVCLAKYQEYDTIEDPHFASKEEWKEMYDEVVGQIMESSDDLIQRIANGEEVRGVDPKSNSDLFGW